MGAPMRRRSKRGSQPKAPGINCLAEMVHVQLLSCATDQQGSTVGGAQEMGACGAPGSRTIP